VRFQVVHARKTIKQRTTTNAITGGLPMADKNTQPHDDEHIDDMPPVDADTMEIFAFVYANQPRLITGDDA